MKRKNVVQIFTLLILLSAFPFFGLHADPITLGRSITWVQGDKWNPTQMALVRTEFDEDISYGSKEYTGPQTAEALMSTFDKNYDRKHLRTVVTVFSKASITEIKRDEMMGIHEWAERLSKEGISSRFKITEVDGRYPREAWLQLLLERGITIESLIDYFFSMAHRYQLAFLEDNPHLWETETHGTSPTDAWETYKTNHIDRFVRYYTRNWKTPAGVSKKRVEATKKRIAASKARVATSKTRIKAKTETSNNSEQPAEHQKQAPELPKMDLQSLQNLVDQLEQIAEDLEHQNRWKAADGVKEVLEHVKKALAHDKTPKPSSKEPNRGEKKKSRYPPL